MINKPLNIPGRRKVITKNMILEAQKHTKSNMEAARWMSVSYNTYRKWAKYYDVFDQHLNQTDHKHYHDSYLCIHLNYIHQKDSYNMEYQ